MWFPPVVWRMILLLTQDATETTDGNLSQAVWQPARLCISLFRSHRHPGLFAAADASGAHRPFLPRRTPDRSDHHTGIGQTHAGVSAVGRGVCAQPPHHDRMGRRQGPQGERPQARRLRPAVRHQHGAAQAIRPVLHPQKPGTRPEVYCATAEVPTDDPNYRIVRRRRSRYTHYYFYIRDEVIGPFVLCIGSFLPFQTTYYLNGHHILAGELQRRGVRFRKDDNAFLWTGNVAALQAAADGLDPEAIRRRLDYWTLVLGPKFSKSDRTAINLRRDYSINQIEFCRNFVFRRHFPIHKIFERSCELGLFRLSADVVTQIFGVRKHKRLRGKLHTMLENLPALRAKLMAVTDRLAGVEADLLNVHVDFPVFERLAKPVAVGRTKVPGIKIQDTRI